MSTEPHIPSQGLSFRDKLDQLSREREVLIAQRDLARAGVRAGMHLIHAVTGARGQLEIRRSGRDAGIDVRLEDGSRAAYCGDWRIAGV